MRTEQQTVILGIAAPRGFYLALAGLVVVVTALVNAGNLNNADAVRRLNVAHSWWAGTPEVIPEDYVAIWAIDPSGQHHAIYGIGQSLVLLPADLAASAVARLAPMPEAARRPAREALVAFLSQALIVPAAVLLGYLLLRRLGFGHPASAAGAAALLGATSVLHYVQNCQENALLLACALGGFFFAASWVSTGERRFAALAGAASGFGLLTRLTTLADACAVILFVALATRERRAWGRFLAGYLPVLAGFAALERLYHFARFAEWTGTYYQVAQSGEKLYGFPPGPGVSAALWSPQNSIFLFDPLLGVACVLAVTLWGRMGGTRRAYVAASAVLLAVLVAFYSSYFNPTGEVSWGDRYVSVPVHLLALLAVPLALERLGARGRRAVLAVAAVSVAIQVASLLLISSVEVDQAQRFGLRWLIPLRFENAWAVLTGGTGAATIWTGIPEEWRRWNLLPFQMELRYPGLARAAIAGWVVLLAAAGWLAARVAKLARQPVSSTLPGGTCGEGARR
jgi:hypothetical protein